MPTVELTTRIDAPIERVFDLARSVEAHEASVATTGERAVGQVTEGLLGDGDRVTWRGSHFGFTLERTAEVTGYDRPRWFRDEQVAGPFAEMVHDHRFERHRGVTRMTDECSFVLPYGPLGEFLGSRFLTGYLELRLRERADHLRRVAESGDEWRRYLES